MSHTSAARRLGMLASCLIYLTVAHAGSVGDKHKNWDMLSRRELAGLDMSDKLLQAHVASRIPEVVIQCLVMCGRFLGMYKKQIMVVELLGNLNITRPKAPEVCWMNRGLVGNGIWLVIHRCGGR